MPRKTLLFGNGLGLALSDQAFSLDSALDVVWRDENALSAEQRELIRGCLPSDTELQRPSSEDDLDMLQRVLASCDFLDSIAIDGEAHWLSTEGREFPAAIRRFVHRVACCFHNTGYELPRSFSDPLQRFIHDTKSHVATVNYDPLLYDSFLRSRVLSGYSGDLIDGVTNAGFRPANLFRRDPERLGWYLHLHGSPLFYDGDDGRVRKMGRGSLVGGVVDSTHLVLTHVRHKGAIVSSSEILSEYWSYFERALRESSEIIVFGYSGYDTHLNEILARFSNKVRMRVVEWSRSQPSMNRTGYWFEKLKSDIDLVQLEDVLSFTDW